MPYIQVINEAEATGELKEVYEEIITHRGKLPNIMKIHSLHPDAMKKHMDLYRILLFGSSGLSREERELIAVVVSSANRCDYCINHHAAALHHYLKDQQAVQQVIDDFRSAALSERKHRMLAYAEKLTKTPHEMNEKDVESLRTAGFSDEDILSINLISGYFNFVNRIALGLGVQFSEKEVSGYKY